MGQHKHNHKQTRFCKLRRIVPLFVTTTLLTGGSMSTGDVDLPDGFNQAIEIQANIFTSSSQDHPSIAVDPVSGEIVLAWDSRRQERGTYGVFARRFSANGTPISPELRINECFPGTQWRPAVSIDGKGGSWFAWESDSQDGSGSGIVARRFMPGFTDATAEIAVNETRLNSQYAPAIAASDSGHAAVVWVSPVAIQTDNGHTSVSVIHARVFQPDGSASSVEITLGNADGSCTNGMPTIAALPNEQFVAIWAETNLQDDSIQVLAQHFNRAGSTLGDVIIINPEDGNNHVEPAIDIDQKGQWVVTWMASQENGYAVFGRRFSQNGIPLDKEFVVATPDLGWKSGAAVAVAPDGRFMITYNNEIQDRSDTAEGIFAKYYNADGSLAHNEQIRISQSIDGKQQIGIATGVSRAQWSENDQIVFGWSGKSNDGDSSGVNLTLFSPDNLNSNTPLQDQGSVRFAARLYNSQDILAPNPPVWDPNWEPLEPVGGVAGDGPDFGFEAVTSTGWTPPDPEMAVGHDTIVVMTNGEIAAFTKAGANLWRDEIENSFGFWGSLGADNFVFDPEVLWDPQAERFLAMACERSDNGRSNFLLAVSKDDSPDTASDWWKWRLDVTSISDNDIDSPNMAVDADHVYLTADFFGPDKYLVYVLEKAPLLTGGAINDTHELITGSSQQSMGIPVTYDADAPAQYIIQSTEVANNNTIIFHAVQNPLTSYSRATYTLSVPTYQYPNQPPQKGTSSRPFLFEPRFWSCVYRNGSLWAVHHVNSSRARARWYEFDMNGWPDSGSNPSIKQTGEIDLGGDIHTFFPSINVDDLGNAAITFARSSSSEYISMSRVVRAADDAPDTFRAAEFVKESNAYTTSGRWGDYSFTQADPDTPGMFWGHHEFMLSTNAWRTWIGQYILESEDRMILTASGLIAGGNATFQTDDATPGNTVYVTYSVAGLGTTNVPALGVVLEIANAKLAGSSTADGSGTATMIKPIPGGASGTDIWLQSIEMDRRSNVVADTIQ